MTTKVYLVIGHVEHETKEVKRALLTREEAETAMIEEKSAQFGYLYDKFTIEEMEIG